MTKTSICLVLLASFSPLLVTAEEETEIPAVMTSAVEGYTGPALWVSARAVPGRRDCSTSI